MENGWWYPAAIRRRPGGRMFSRESILGRDEAGGSYNLGGLREGSLLTAAVDVGRVVMAGWRLTSKSSRGRSPF